MHLPRMIMFDTENYYLLVILFFENKYYFWNFDVCLNIDVISYKL